MLNSRFLLSESLPRLVSLSVNQYQHSVVFRAGYSASGVTLFRPVQLPESRRETSTSVSVASSVHSEGLPPSFLCNRRQTSEGRSPPGNDLSRRMA